jgi:hypothetical protein
MDIYDPELLDKRSRIHNKKFGSKYTLLLIGDSVYIELSQSGTYYDNQVRTIRLGSINPNNCFIPDLMIRFNHTKKVGLSNEIIKVNDRVISTTNNHDCDLWEFCEYVGVSLSTLLKQCKKLALRYSPPRDQYDNRVERNKQRSRLKKIKIK